MKRILFVCNFASVHARTYIAYFAKQRKFDVHVISSFAADEMNGVNLISLTHSSMAASSRVATIARTVGSWHPLLYKNLTVFNRKRVTQKRLSKLDDIELPFEPDIIHAHRTQPEGILGVALAERYPKAKFCLTTWGQDFTFWARNSRWLDLHSQRAVARLDIALPDNARDGRILKERYGFEKAIRVMPATGGLDTSFLEEQYTLAPQPKIQEGPNFLSMRGYENSTIQIHSLIKAFHRFRKENNLGHLYIDTHRPGTPERDVEMRRWIDDLNLSDFVTIVALSREEMFAYMKHCDFYVSDTNADGLPMSLLESIYFGQIPVVFDHESTAPLKGQFERFYCFNHHSVDCIYAAWMQAYSDGRLTAEQRKQNLESIDLHYNRDRNLELIAKECYSI